MRQSTRLSSEPDDEGTSEQAAACCAHDTDIDPAQVVRALGLDNVQRIDPVSGGSDTLIWRLETSIEVYALRLFRLNQSKVAQREVAAMTAARAQGLSVPSIVRQGVWGDRPAMVISWMPGQTLRAALMDHPEEARAFGEAFGQEQARIHQCSASALLGESDLRWLDIPGVDRNIIEQVRRACVHSQMLVHLDYHPLNVLVEQGAISAILDWTNAQAGDARCDLARTETIQTFVPLQDGETLAARNALSSGWRRGYMAETGPVSGMGPFRTWAAAFMAHDLRPRLGRPDLPWLTEAMLARVRDWATVQDGQPDADWL